MTDGWRSRPTSQKFASAYLIPLCASLRTNLKNLTVTHNTDRVATSLAFPFDVA